jgi:inner membrane protein involved in colicin E2 resistance
MKMLDQSRVPLMFLQVWGVIGCVITLACAYGIWKGLPWSRVLYVVWNVIGILVSFFTTPQQALILVSIVIFVVIAAFLFTNRANEWFAARGFALKREDPITPR